MNGSSTGGSFSEVYTGLDLEHTLEDLSPGHWYRLRLACISEGGVSDVSYWESFFSFDIIKPKFCWVLSSHGHVIVTENCLKLRTLVLHNFAFT